MAKYSATRSILVLEECGRIHTVGICDCVNHCERFTNVFVLEVEGLFDEKQKYVRKIDGKGLGVNSYEEERLGKG